MVEIVDPTPEVKFRAKDKLAPRPESLDGKVLGLFRNSGWLGAADEVEKRYPYTPFAEELTKEFKLAGIIWGAKPYASRVAPKEIMDGFTSKVDVIINGMCV